MMVNTYISWWRRRWNAEYPTQSVPEPAAPGLDLDQRQDLLSALAALPKGQRAVIVLRFFDDLTEAQTAQRPGLQPGDRQEPERAGTDGAASLPCAGRHRGRTAMSDVEDRLRDALQDLAPTDPPTQGLAAGAWRHHARERRRRLLVTATAAAVVILAGAGVVVRSLERPASGDSRGPPAHPWRLHHHCAAHR